jgi:hypothetical protein
MSTARCAAGLRDALALAALALCWLALQCGVAAANEFHVFSCEDPYTGQAAPAADWSFDQATNGYGDGDGSSCAGGGGSISAWMDGGVTHGFGEGGYANFNAPGAMTISAFELWRYEAVGPYEPYAAPATNIAYNPGNVSIEGLCVQSLGCSSRGNPQDHLASGSAVGASGLVGVTQISTSAVCGGGPGTSYVCPTSNAENGNSAEIDVYAADITLVDPTVPTVSNVNGSLTSGASLSGDASISFSASDSGGPGLYSGKISVDGNPVVNQILDTNGGACQSLGGTSDGLRSFDDPQPCKSSMSAALTLNTSTLRPGTHSVLVTVDDASGNSATVWDGTITTALSPHVPNGTPACEQAQLSLAVNGKSHHAAVRYGHRAMITGLLRCGTAPIASGTVTVRGGGVATELVSATDGTFIYSVPNGPSRTLRFSYRAYSDDPLPAANARAVISVIPRIRLTIRPLRTHNGGTIHWRGRLPDGPYPADGVTLLVEVRAGRRWQPFDEVVAEKGRFAYRYTFLRTTRPTSYRFRVALPASGSAGYDYQPGASNQITVRVA